VQLACLGPGGTGSSVRIVVTQAVGLSALPIGRPSLTGKRDPRLDCHAAAKLANLLPIGASCRNHGQTWESVGGSAGPKIVKRTKGRGMRRSRPGCTRAFVLVGRPTDVSLESFRGSDIRSEATPGLCGSRLGIARERQSGGTAGHVTELVSRCCPLRRETPNRRGTFHHCRRLLPRSRVHS
jgi:hypothetical protein